MADRVEMQDIRGLDIDKTVKGFSLVEYIFKNDCTVSSMTGDALRWYQESAADLTATAPSKVANIDALSAFTLLEVSWTRNTSYARKYAVEGLISMEDIQTADIDVLARTLLRLTRAVVKQVDTRIWDVMTNALKTPTGLATDINMITTSGAWEPHGITAINPIRDILEAKKAIWTSGSYNPEGAILYLSPTDYTNLQGWLINVKGGSIPGWSSQKIETGVVMQILGLKIKVSPNVTADYAAVVIPKQACTWKTVNGTTGVSIKDPGIGTTIRVWETGEAILTDPKAVCLISDTQ